MRGLSQAELAAVTGVSRQTINCGVLLASRRSETVEGLLDRRDERISEIDLKDTDFTGGVLVTASSSPSSWVGIQPSGTTCPSQAVHGVDVGRPQQGTIDLATIDIISACCAPERVACSGQSSSRGRAMQVRSTASCTTRQCHSPRRQQPPLRRLVPPIHHRLYALSVGVGQEQAS
jgi:hypothetical protein